MLDLRKTAESIYHNLPENSVAQSQEADELRQQTSSHVKATLEKAPQPEQTEQKSAADILYGFVARLQRGKRKKVILDIARRTAGVQDFGTSELSKMHQTKINNVRLILQFLFDSLEKLGLRKIQTTEFKKDGHRNHYLIIESIKKPSKLPKETNKEKIKKGRTQYEKVVRNLDFIPNKFHDVLLFLALSSKYHNWVDYDDVVKGAKKPRDTASTQIKSLGKLLPKIGIKLLEEKTKRGKKHFHLAKLDKDDNKRKNFQEKKKERKNPSGDHVAKMRQRHKIRMVSTSDVIKANWNKRNLREEWYEDDEFQHPPRKLWEDASGKGGSV